MKGLGTRHAVVVGMLCCVVLFSTPDMWEQVPRYVCHVGITMHNSTPLAF